MAEPTPPHSVAASARAGKWRRALAGLASLALILQVALGLRVVAADLLDLYVHRGGSRKFVSVPDTTIYWGLARAIRTGGPYEYVEWSDIPHFASRSVHRVSAVSCDLSGGFRPADFGDPTGPGGLGAVCVFLVYRLTKQIAFADGPGPPCGTPVPGSGPHLWSPRR